MHSSLNRWGREAASVCVCVPHHSFPCWTMSFEGNLIDTKTWKSTVCFTTQFCSVAAQQQQQQDNLSRSHSHSLIKYYTCEVNEHTMFATHWTSHTYFVQWEGKWMTKAIQTYIVTSKCDVLMTFFSWVGRGRANERASQKGEKGECVCVCMSGCNTFLWHSYQRRAHVLYPSYQVIVPSI